MKFLPVILFPFILAGCDFKLDYFFAIDLNPPPEAVGEGLANSFDLPITGMENDQTLDDSFSISSGLGAGTLAFFNVPQFVFQPTTVVTDLESLTFVENNFLVRYSFTVDSGDLTFSDEIGRYKYEGPVSCDFRGVMNGLWNGDEETLTDINFSITDDVDTTSLTCEATCELADQTECTAFNYGFIRNELEIKMIDSDVDLTPLADGITDSEITFLLKVQDAAADNAGFAAVGLQYQVTMTLTPK